MALDPKRERLIRLELEPEGSCLDFVQCQPVRGQVDGTLVQRSENAFSGRRGHTFSPWLDRSENSSSNSSSIGRSLYFR